MVVRVEYYADDEIQLNIFTLIHDCANNDFMFKGSMTSDPKK